MKYEIIIWSFLFVVPILWFMKFVINIYLNSYTLRFLLMVTCDLISFLFFLLSVVQMTGFHSLNFNLPFIVLCFNFFTTIYLLNIEEEINENNSTK